MYLRNVRIGEWFYKSVPIVLVFSDIMSKSFYHHFVVSFGLTVRLRVIHCRDRVLDDKEFEQRREEFGG